MPNQSAPEAAALTRSPATLPCTVRFTKPLEPEWLFSKYDTYAPRYQRGRQQLNRHLNAGSVAINHVQHRNTAYGLNLRAFEATGAGACLFTPVVFDLASCYEPGIEVVSYRSTDELAELVKRSLSDPAWSRKIAVAGHRRALAEHTFVHRARTIATHCGLT